MMHVIQSYEERGWRISVNDRKQVIFREPDGLGWFSLLNCSDGEAKYINRLY